MKSVCVFCGSSLGANPAYADAARALGGLLAARGLKLVYGGGKIGLMGLVADAALAGGGEVIGVIPGFLSQREVEHRGLSELFEVDSMHARKALMAELSDAFIVLPGGFGTLDEMFEILTWAQLGLHDKPLGVLNTSGYFDKLLAFFDQVAGERLIMVEDRRRPLVETDSEAILARLDDACRLSRGRAAAIKRARDGTTSLAAPEN